LFAQGAATGASTDSARRRGGERTRGIGRASACGGARATARCLHAGAFGFDDEGGKKEKEEGVDAKENRREKEEKTTTIHADRALSADAAGGGGGRRKGPDDPRTTSTNQGILSAAGANR
jgi:hypothetical protein